MKSLNFFRIAFLVTISCNFAMAKAKQEVLRPKVIEQAKKAEDSKKDEEAAGVLYRMDKQGRVLAVPFSKERAQEHNLGAEKLSEKKLQELAVLDEKGVLVKKGDKTAALRARARKVSSNEFNDADASAKPALYFSFGFGRPYWGNPFYNNYRPYYYGGYYAPSVLYVGGYNNNYYNCYNPWFVRPYYYNNYYYSYYNYTGYC